MLESKCPCCSGRTFASCCQPFLLGDAMPSNAEALMRSRYTAYSLADIDYIEQTMCGLALNGFDKAAAYEWAKEVTWQKLAVLRCWRSSTEQAYVEFLAYLMIENKRSILHEISMFQRIQERWYYVSGTKPEVGRNQPCPCGSRKKAKRCCFS